MNNKQQKISIKNAIYIQRTGVHLAPIEAHFVSVCIDHAEIQPEIHQNGAHLLPLVNGASNPDGDEDCVWKLDGTQWFPL